MILLIWAALLILVLVLQVTIVPLIAINGVAPDLLLILVVSTGLLLGKEKGVGIGFFSGLLQDLAVGNIFGINIFSKLATGYILGLAERKVFKDHLLLPLLAIAIATVFSNFVSIAVLLLFLDYKINFVAITFNYILPLLGYNLIFSIPIHRIVSRVLTIQREMRF